MIHNLRRKDGTIYPVDVEIGSGIQDKNGREIFEGDNVLHHKDFISRIEFRNGALCLEGSPLGFYDEKSITVIND